MAGQASCIRAVGIHHVDVRLLFRELSKAILPFPPALPPPARLTWKAAGAQASMSCRASDSGLVASKQ